MTELFKSAAFNRFLGVVFVMMLLGGVYLTYALFTKKFTDYTVVTMQANKAGLQLPARADVKLRGKFVGEVLSVKGAAEGATLELGLFADEVDVIPADVTGALVPKTLFGEKFVDLRIPQGGGSSESIEAGAVIKQVVLPEEIEDVLSTLFPLLRTVEPAQINFTLNALSTALDGRGEDLGEGLVTANAYLKRLNPELPQAIEDITLLGGTADVYASIAPELGTLLRNQVVTLGTVEELEPELRQTLRETGSLSGTLETFLDENGRNLVRSATLGRTQTRVLAKYAPEYPCLTSSIVTFFEDYNGNWRGNRLNINLEVLERQPRGYTAADSPVFGEKQGPLSTSLCRAAENGAYGQDRLPPPVYTPDFADGAGSTGKGERPGASRSGTAFSPSRTATDFDDLSTSDLDVLLGSSASAPRR